MIDDDRETLRSIAWSELFPWLLLFRCFRISVRLRPLLVCAAAARKAAPKAGARTATPAVRKIARKTVRKTT